jgi:methyl-accepting chemotaxis protein
MAIGQHITIKRKLVYAFITLAAAVALVSTLATGVMLRHAQSNSLQFKGLGAGRMLSSAIAPTVLSDLKFSFGTTDSALSNVKGDPDISMAAVVATADGKPLVLFSKKFNEDAKLDAFSIAGPLGAGKTDYSKAGYLVCAFPFDPSDAEAGKTYYMMMVLNTDSMNRQLRFSLLLMVLLGIAMAGAGAGAAYLLSRTIVKPLELIRQGMLDISEGEGDLTARLAVNGDDEIAQMSRHFNQFVANIQGIVNQVVTISGTIASGSLEMSAGMAEMDSTAEAIARTAENQKASVLQANDKVGAIASSSQIVYANVGNALKVFEQAQEAADQGGAAVREVVVGMEAINTNSKQIGNILSVITDIANQTNLLSLNAAIEAAKAGEHGKGFAVVAEEVRKLAERCSLAAKEITVLIKTSNKSIQEGRVKVGAAGEGLKSIQEGIAASGGHIRDIGGQSHAQSEDSKAVVGFMADLSGIAEQNAAATEEMAATIRETSRTVDELSRAAEGLNALVARFKA